MLAGQLETSQTEMTPGQRCQVAERMQQFTMPQAVSLAKDCLGHG